MQEGGRFLEMTLREIDILDKNTFQKYFKNVQTSTNTYKVRKFATLWVFYNKIYRPIIKGNDTTW